MPSSQKYEVHHENPPKRQPRVWNEQTTFRSELGKCRKFLWNADTKEFAGRGGASWGKIGLFYLIFYALLAGLFAIMITGLLKTMDENVPRRVYNPDNPGEQWINSVPGMGFKPRASEATRYTSGPVISFSQSSAASYSGYTADLDSFLDPYETTLEQNVSCGTNAVVKNCNLRLNQLGPCASPNYGYNESKPCVLLKINKIMNWVPTNFSSNPAPTLLGGRWTGDHIGISCEGYTAKDLVSVGTMSFYPPNGFSFDCFPYCRKDVPYLSPVVMVQFDNLAVGQETQVWCKAWFANLGESGKHNRNDKNAGIRFSVLMNA